MKLFVSINSHIQILEAHNQFQTIMQSEDQVYFLINLKLTLGLCLTQTWEKFTSGKSSELVPFERI